MFPPPLIQFQAIVGKTWNTFLGFWGPKRHRIQTILFKVNPRPRGALSTVQASLRMPNFYSLDPLSRFPSNPLIIQYMTPWRCVTASYSLIIKVPFFLLFSFNMENPKKKEKRILLGYVAILKVSVEFEEGATFSDTQRRVKS